MKKMILAVLALVAGACASPTAPRRPQPTGAIQKAAGDACTDASGRSGYLVYAGNKLVCYT